MDDFEKELKLGFLEEAGQMLEDVEAAFLTLETSPQDRSTLEHIFRIAHNLKGSAKAVGFDDLGALTHKLESFLIKMKDGAIPVIPASMELLLRSADCIREILAALRDDLSAKTDSSALSREIEERTANGFEAEVNSATIAQPSLAETIPDAADTQFEEDDTVMPAIAVVPEPEPETVIAAPVQASVAQAEPPKKTSESSKAVDDSLRVSLARVEKLLNYVGEIVILQTVLREQMGGSHSQLLRNTVHQMGKVTKEVQDLAMGLRMVPLKPTFQKMQRIVRDTSLTLGKKINLEIEGEETEVDKPILESLADPLVHLIRNAVDHGVETPERRVEAGKPEFGKIRLSGHHQSGNLVIEIRDDGAGMNADRLRRKAVEKGILKSVDAMADKDAYDLIFHSGFSTKEAVTDVSGRGVGMDVVRTNIEKLQGKILIETEAGKGTCFRIELPLTLAIIDALVVACARERYIFPLSHVHESLRPNPKDVHFVSGVGEILSLRGEQIPLYRLNIILNPISKYQPVEECTAIVVRTEEKPFAMLVDDILGQQQVVIKQLGDETKHLKGFGGSAILGDGRPGLILEAGDLARIGKSRPAVAPTMAERKASA